MIMEASWLLHKTAFSYGDPFLHGLMQPAARVVDESRRDGLCVPVVARLTIQKPVAPDGSTLDVGVFYVDESKEEEEVKEDA